MKAFGRLTVFKSFQRWRRRLWWFDVVYPVALGTLLFGILSYIIYAGQPQWRLSLQAEKNLLQFSLREASRRLAPSPPAVLVVSAEASRFVPRPDGKPGRYPDASIAAYGDVLTRLAQDQVPLIFVRWNLENHPVDDPEYFALGRVLMELKAKTKVFFVVPRDQLEGLPTQIVANAQRLEDTSCDDLSEVLAVCPYIPSYREWVMQKMIETMAAAGDQERPPWVSSHLPSADPGYILRLQPPQALTTLDFSEVLAAKVSPSPWRAAFVGPTFQASAHSAGARPTTLLTVFDHTGVGATGTQPHVFWAQLADMFAQSGEVQVAPRAVVVLLTLGFCAMLIAITIYYELSSGLVAFLLFALTAPLVNAAALRLAHVYVPLFDGYYFGLSVLLVAGLVHLSVLTVQRWRLEAQSRLHGRSVDLKGNFISLLTHNLNTPVAKMQGMLALLTKQSADAAWTTAAAAAEALVIQLEYSIRSVLLAAALEEGVVHPTARHAAGLAQDVLAGFAASLKKLGVLLQPPVVTSADDGGEWLPLTFDVRAVTAAIGAVAALFHGHGEATPVGLTLHVSQEEADPMLRVTLSSEVRWIGSEAAAILTMPTRQTVRTVADGAFFAAVLAGLAQLTAATFRGWVEVAASGEGGEVRLYFRAMPMAG